MADEILHYNDKMPNVIRTFTEIHFNSLQTNIRKLLRLTYNGLYLTIQINGHLMGITFITGDFDLDFHGDYFCF